MRVKTLELLGFKSFLSRTVLEFGPGFTGIVGPNGCGKSNIGDAMRWVLGEQSPKSLRGKRMEDVIFSGSGGKKPLGMAEVSLTLTDTSSQISIPPWRDYHELTITRRLYRSGESEYLINKTPCRLKDIIDVFLDTGISTGSFTLVEQGKVEALISAKPEDRRVLIEEAAGVMRYKHRRNAALRKLEGAEANLLRLTDIIQEVERQCRSLKRQARKAKYFKQYQAEIRDFELKLSALEYGALDGELAPLEREFRRLNEEVQGLEAATSASETRAEALRAELARRGEALTKARERFSELGLRVESLESQGQFLSRQLQDLERRDEERGKELEALREEFQGLLSKAGDARVKREALLREVQEREKFLRERGGELEGLKEELTEREKEIGQARASSLSAADALTRAKTEQSLLRSEEDSLERALKRLREEREALGRKCEALSERKEEVRRALSQALIQLNSLKFRVVRLKETLGGEGERVAEILGNLSRRREELGALSFHLESLRKEEGDENGMGILLARREELRLRGPLSELLNVEPPFEKAIEAILGERLKGVLAEGPREGAAALELFKGQGGGRTTFLPLKPRVTERGIPEPERVPGLIGRATELVSAPGELGPALESLLGGFYVVEDLATALSLWDRGEAPAMVTLEGEVLFPPGELTGGTHRVGPLEKRRQRRELEEKARLMEAEMEKLSEALEGAEGRKEGLRREIEGLEEKLQGAGLERVAASSTLEASKREERDLAAELETIGMEEKGLLSERDSLSEKLSQGSSRLAELSSELEARDEATSRLSSLFQELRGRVEAKEAQVTEARISLVEARAQLQNAEAEGAHLEDRLSSLKERIRRCEEEGSELSQKAREIQKARQRGIEESEVLRREQGEAARLAAEREASLREGELSLEEEEVCCKEHRRKASSLRDEFAGVAERRTELRVRIEELQERVRSSLRVELREEAASLSGEGEDMVAVSQRLEGLRERVQKMGDVNLLALREYEELSERYNFLKAQEEDLRKSTSDLRLTIDRINRTTKSRFARAFKAVDESFGQVFQKLFGGGFARLVLTNEEDLLEAGVDIEVQPPGKKLTNITLLSAGEKALSALALLFAVFSVRPSPFCLLDEVDATLDDGNVGRFRDLLRSLESKTQFLVITHNKRTMTFADVLYGITMQEEGISKVVSVRLNQDGRGEKPEPILTEGNSGSG